MSVSTLAVCLLLLAVAIPSAIGQVSKEDIKCIEKGIDAGHQFTDTLAKASGFDDFMKIVEKMNDMLGPWLDGIGIFSDVLDLFLPEDTAVLDAMKEGFKEVNKRLDDIKEGLEEVKEAIDWAVVKINFQAIEQDIRLMDEKLKECIQSPKPEDGMAEYIRVYKVQYNEAGILLWDAIVKNDQVFSQNVLRAGMEYTDYRRSKMNNFMKGCIALLMKSANIEISYEKFMDQERGLIKIWKERLLESQHAFQKADNELENAWKKLFPGEVDELSRKHEGLDHSAFSDMVYNFLTEKYSWMYWFVLIYDPCSGWDNHAVRGTTTFTHRRFRHYGRNFQISCTYPSTRFDLNEAREAITTKHCPQSVDDHECKRSSGKYVLEAIPFLGISQAVLGLNVNSQTRVAILRSVTKKMYILLHNHLRVYHFVTYFG